MNYIELEIAIPNNNQGIIDIVTAFLSNINFESFYEKESKLYAYINEKDFDSSLTKEILENYNLKFEKKIVAQQNWNKEWEQNFQPIIIDNILTIKSSYHDININTTHCITIDPKMSFGTGHHATTYLMCKLIAENNFNGKKVLDFGCGTGVLAIYASILGAAEVVAVDIDEWAFNNSIENKTINKVENIKVIQGDIANVPNQIYDIIFANINLNVLKKDIPLLNKLMKPNSIILLSGFLENEYKQIEAIAKTCNFSLINLLVKDEWTALSFIKK